MGCQSTINPSIWETEARGSEFKVSLNYMRHVGGRTNLNIQRSIT